MIFKVLLIGVIIVYIGGILWAIRTERKNWNGGVCPRCGTNLRKFDTDSRGCEGWVCDNCHHTIWVSYLKFVYKNKKT